MSSSGQQRQIEPQHFAPLVKPRRLSFLESFHLRMNAKLVTIADLHIVGKNPEDVSLEDILANLDASGYLILFVSFVSIVVAALVSVLFFVGLAEQIPGLAFIGGVSTLLIVPSLLTGIEVCYLLFRLRRWLRS